MKAPWISVLEPPPQTPRNYTLPALFAITFSLGVAIGLLIGWAK